MGKDDSDSFAINLGPRNAAFTLNKPYEKQKVKKKKKTKI